MIRMCGPPVLAALPGLGAPSCLGRKGRGRERVALRSGEVGSRPALLSEVGTALCPGVSLVGPLALQLWRRGTQRLHLTLAPGWPTPVSGAGARGMSPLERAGAGLLTSTQHSA